MYFNRYLAVTRVANTETDTDIQFADIDISVTAEYID